MNYKRDVLTDYNFQLDRFERSLKELHYNGLYDPSVLDFAARVALRDLPEGGVTLPQIAEILSSESVGPPHGFDLLQPHPLPEIPALPSLPAEATAPVSQPAPSFFSRIFGEKRQPENQVSAPAAAILKRFEELSRRREEVAQNLQRKLRAEVVELEQIRQACLSKDPAAIRRLMELSFLRHPLPTALSMPASFYLDVPSRIALCTIQIPDFSHLTIVRKRSDSWKAKWLSVGAAERKRSTEAILYSLCLRAAYLVAKSDSGNWFDTVAVNAEQHWHDPATGAPRDGAIASLQALKSELVALQLDRIDAKACFRHFKGISTPSTDKVAPVRPIFVLDKDDDRVVGNRDVAAQMEEETNLAAMPWEDFEQLVRQLFEWEFGRNGVEVKVTRASRDRGVDAIMYDPDPLRGGKFVLQAKRYTRTVDVAAVRDLYGTVVNEGANRGILVATSSYGPDSYEFAKNKPISLVDGPNLIAMLKRHGCAFRIDLEEARRLNME
ncbi:restriction endonuclease [Methylocystis iwaonis]|uniref:Restriction endonuclease n=1 Tax=Methylocystis iwaonis TaxID=2885079 RepID=A0ABM8EF87_9HYPH|nr:restriction endonuclease [Methylocystis iwaonis]BDV36718.1 restriction endonuclease [Methylocystis iwaonis]